MRAATGEVVSAEELGGGNTHTSISGVCDYLARDENEALLITRQVLLIRFSTILVLSLILNLMKIFQGNMKTEDRNFRKWNICTTHLPKHCLPQKI